MHHDLFSAEYRPEDCPTWAKEELPAWVLPHVGRNGSPASYRDQPGPFSSVVCGIDRYQANWFICHNEQTAKYLDEAYTPLNVGYVRGTLPAFERLSARYTAGLTRDADKAIALLNALPEIVRHPVMPPIGPPTAMDRNLLDDDLLASGQAWCNEQARIFIRLCQAINIPARLIHLFGQHHTIAEFYVDGGWALADASIFFVVRDASGKLLSAAACHDQGAGQRAYALAKQQAMQRIAAKSDAELGFRTPEQAAKFRHTVETFDAEALARQTNLFFGVINTPLPPAAQPQAAA